MLCGIKQQIRGAQARTGIRFQRLLALVVFHKGKCRIASVIIRRNADVLVREPLFESLEKLNLDTVWPFDRNDDGDVPSARDVKDYIEWGFVGFVFVVERVGYHFGPTIQVDLFPVGLGKTLCHGCLRFGKEIGPLWRGACGIILPIIDIAPIAVYFFPRENKRLKNDDQNAKREEDKPNDARFFFTEFSPEFSKPGLCRIGAHALPPTLIRGSIKPYVRSSMIRPI